MECELEEIYFGETLGSKWLYQITAQQFQLECLTSNLSAGDSTGLRAYNGSHVVIRFITTYPQFVAGKKVVELGCGIGVLGLVGTLLGCPSLLVLTDREARGKEIVAKNIKHFTTPLAAPVYQQLVWGNSEDTRKTLELCGKATNENEFYDIVLGSELMYFNTDVDLMVQAVMALTNERGVFIHGHLFRGKNQEHHLITHLAAHHWQTIEIPHKEFISETELKQHAEWYNVRPLISGPENVIAKFIEEHPSWRVFVEWLEEGEGSDTTADNFEVTSVFT